MESGIYCIHCYEGGITSVLGFHSKESAYGKFKELCEHIKKESDKFGLSFDEWDETGGVEIACMGLDTIYRLCYYSTENNESYDTAYTEYQDDGRYQLREVEVGSYELCRNYLKNFIKENATTNKDTMDLVSANIDYVRFSNSCDLEVIGFVNEIEFED